MGLSVTDRIELYVYGSDSLKEAWTHYIELVSVETLAKKTEWTETDGQIAIEAGEETWKVKIVKA